FTDAESPRKLFREALVMPKPDHRVLYIQGVGGVGKSSLLRMFRLYCKIGGIPVGLVSGDEITSVVDVLYNWADDLKSDGITLPNFVKTSKYYRSIQAKVAEQIRKAQENRDD